jgi:hypothetical protein
LTAATSPRFFVWSRLTPTLTVGGRMHRYVRTEFRTVDEVVDALVGLEAHFLAHRDRRGVFATGYLAITRAIQRHMEGGGFEDREWTTRYTVRFANLYRVALLDYEDRAPSRVPKAWRIAFDAARADVGLVIQHLILGVNAHINHDLAVALCDVGIDPERDRRYADHARVNQVLEGATAAMKHRVAALYAPVLHRLDRMAGRIDDDVTNFSIPKAREHAWAFAIALTAARRDAERAVLRAALDDQAAVLARLVLASPTRHPAFLNSVRFVERLDSLARRVPRSFSPLGLP